MHCDASVAVHMVQNITAITEVVSLSVADPGVLDAANTVISAARSNALLTGFNVKALVAVPEVQAALVQLIEAAETASGPWWDAVVPHTSEVTKVRYLLLLPALLGAFSCRS
jgi:hypothetical protein